MRFMNFMKDFINNLRCAKLEVLLSKINLEDRCSCESKTKPSALAIVKGHKVGGK